MHDINFTHKHELKDHDFLGCCKDCRTSLNIIKPHIMGFAERIKKYTRATLAKLEPEDLYRLYQIIFAKFSKILKKIYTSFSGRIPGCERFFINRFNPSILRDKKSSKRSGLLEGPTIQPFCGAG